jgi:UDP-N-acetylglucosamine--N-acetylmuramyl-(pentapeptide) pyrophosphoryl-undecaprenol N-acetylglucosamine transferase
MSLRVVLTGGGSAGHVNPNIALIEELRAQGCELSYIGSIDGVERAMIEAIHIPYFAVRSGKLRRYFSWKNFSDPFNVVLGIFQAYRFLRQLKPQVVFSKGGFVALPVVIAARLNGIPVIAHESDLTPGLANRLSLPFINTLCVTFPSTRVGVAHQHKLCVTGTPIRAALLHGVAQRGLDFCGFDNSLPCLLVMGGSLGAVRLNEAIRAALPALTAQYQIIHLCGKGNLDPQLSNHPRYRQFEYINAELPDLLAAAHLIISRAGANALLEILACVKPHVLIPLPLERSRGDQIHNAQYFKELGASEVIAESALTQQVLLDMLAQLEAQYAERVEKIKSLHIQSATTTVVDLILRTARPA